ncbi:PGPGW domain-containing protein [Gimibacter soli]|uniref:PGPGW domain-containing protein n=1 Tax=Gimibacter soli TaxID=3024400 RepID=A0AAE9XMV5_9PROT|nr:PGPGW domain-containing protein [Gimibacter soli]WCL53096.1 PGPGW domain-containing protein [Gimibacter soli]
MIRQKIKKTIPNNQLGRLIVGVLLVIGGILGFLPVLGFWMIPLGLVILSVDYPAVRRFRRRMEVRLLRWWHKHRPRRKKDK